MMWGVTMIFLSYVGAQATSHDIKVECHEYDGLPPYNAISPSFLSDLKVELVPEGETYNMNISWAINIDGSIRYLTDTRIMITGDPAYHCRYDPPLGQANLTEPNQKWFHYLVKADYGLNSIQAANLPLPQLGSGKSYKHATITVPRTKQPVTLNTNQVSIAGNTAFHKTPQGTAEVRKDVPVNINYINIAMAIFGGLASLMILSSCYIIYKNHFSRSLHFKLLPTSPIVPVPVLLVYPAENPAFHGGVVALAEFLQGHGGCSVAVDMWQQRKIAELGPMRWLAEQAKAADRVLIICPQAEISSSEPRNCQEPSITAAAHDLYPLILNMVASHAKSASDLAKFWVVQFGKEQAKGPNPVLELRACKTFYLMKDLIKLCRSLHNQREDVKKTSDLMFRPRIEKNALKLKEAVEDLGRWQSNISSEVEMLKSVYTTEHL